MASDNSIFSLVEKAPRCLIIKSDLKYHTPTLLRAIAKSGSGSVFLAFEPFYEECRDNNQCDVEESRFFAAKIFSQKKKFEFLREYSALKSFSHPGIPRFLYSAIMTTGDFFLAEELGCGGTLFGMVSRQKTLSESVAKPIIHQIFSAVAYAHSYQIVHRDIKLENIVFRDAAQQHIMVIDWTTSAKYSSEILLEERYGSLHYASPEILKFQPYRGPEVDSWALGVLTYATLVGFFPFSGLDPFEKLFAMRKLLIPAFLSLEVASLIRSLLHHDPVKRCTPEAALKHSWFDQTQNDPTISIDPE